MVVGAGQQHRAGLWRLAFAGQTHIEAAGAGQPFGHAGGEHLIDVLHQHNRRRKVPRQTFEQDFQRRRATGRRADRHQSFARRRTALRRWRRARARRLVTDQPADIEDFTQQRRRRFPP